MKVETIDLRFQDIEKAIAAFAVDSGDGLVLIETGPESTFEALKTGLFGFGADIKDVKHVLLSHIHFDHAGAAWRLAENGAIIHVNPRGLNHLNDPEKLWNSASRIYGDEMETLWGEMRSISMDNLNPVDEGDILEIGNLKIKVHYTPGHAVHHNVYQIEDFVFTGDVAGVRIGNGPVQPPCPPPDINIELWKDSLEKLRKINPKGLYLTHYGLQTDVDEVLTSLSNTMDSWAQEVLRYYQSKIPSDIAEPEFTEFVGKLLSQSGLSDEEIKIYEAANPSWMSVNGLLRYWRLKEEGRI